MDNIIQNILDALRSGYLGLAYQQKQYLNDLAMSIYHKQNLSPEDIEDLKGIILIGNITYNNTDKELLPLEDGVYDLLLEKYKTYDPNFQVGAEVIKFNASKKNNEVFIEQNLKPAVVFLDNEEIDKITNAEFVEDLLIDETKFIDKRDFECQSVPLDPTYIPKGTHDTQHNHPELVGTLDKCKFVLDRDAIDRGVYNDSNVKTVERDFFADHLRKGIINPSDVFDIVLELKYDGVSVEADCTDEIVSARSRGDTGANKAVDLTPMLKGYKFPHRPKGSKMIGVKFEAIITEYDLPAFNKAKDYEYKNCRSAIVGLMGSSDIYKYRDFITLVPLAVEKSVYENECHCNRLEEIQFLNTYFVTKGCPLRYSSCKGTYLENLFWIKLFTSEAEMMRPYIPFMYDGIVLSYLDENIRQKLGRENYINKYSIAVKFNPLKKQTIFRGYTYTVGQDGSITPMIHYDPVEFYGTIHDKSTGHSFARFQELQLHLGDMLDVEYVNDVMPYVNKPYNDFNIENAKSHPLELFPQLCPICGSPIVISDSGKSAKCTNPSCGGRSLARMVNMCAKLGMNGFGEATLSKIDVNHLEDLFCLLHRIRSDVEDNTHFRILSDLGFGPVEIENMRNEVDNVLTRGLLDTELLGSLGFDNVSNKTWELILSKISLDQFIKGIEFKDDDNIFVDTLKSIKGIGPSTCDTILREYPFFSDDIKYMIKNANIIHYIPNVGKKIRATGFRDKQLFTILNNMGFDADDNGTVTKDTDILLVPMEGYSSTKTQKAQQYGVQIVTVKDFLENVEKYQ